MKRLLTYILLLFPSVVLADNCGNFVDCFETLKMALSAATALSFVSIFLSSLPGLGTYKGIIEAVEGKDSITKEKLENWERILGIIPAGKALGALGDLIKHGDEILDAGKAGEKILDAGKAETALIKGEKEIISTEVIDTNRLNHTFGDSEHYLDEFLSKFDSQEDAFRAIEKAANKALKEGKLNPNSEGILPTDDLGDIIQVEGINIQLIGGKVIAGRVRIGSFSRQGAKDGKFK